MGSGQGPGSRSEGLRAHGEALTRQHRRGDRGGGGRIAWRRGDPLSRMEGADGIVAAFCSHSPASRTRRSPRIGRSDAFLERSMRSGSRTKRSTIRAKRSEGCHARGTHPRRAGALRRRHATLREYLVAGGASVEQVERAARRFALSDPGASADVALARGRCSRPPGRSVRDARDPGSSASRTASPSRLTLRTTSHREAGEHREPPRDARYLRASDSIRPTPPWVAARRARERQRRDREDRGGRPNVAM